MGSADAIRQWHGPAVLSYGFRPFFLLAGLWAAGAMVLWILMLAGSEPLPIGFDPFAWHGHEFLFGYGVAVIAGFLLTAVPNWTGRLPVVGWPLAGLIALWVVGRIAMAVSGWLPFAGVLGADLGLPLALILFLGREIWVGQNWKNLPILGLLALLTLANILFHVERSSDGTGMRLGLAAVLMMITLIGGRIIPSFTRNWLVAQASPHRPVAFGRSDGAAIAVTGLALLGFVLQPTGPVSAALLIAAGLANLWRLSRWQGLRTGAEPLLAVLHCAYGFLVLGFLASGLGALDLLPQAAARHIWMAGAIGLMTLAVMSRAALGHSGRALHAGPGITLLYLALAGAVLARFAAGFGWEIWLHLSAGLWIAAFGGFVLIYWPILTQPKLAPRKPSPRP
jgi:uncharacterized protein involved in response to NO